MGAFELDNLPATNQKTSQKVPVSRTLINSSVVGKIIGMKDEFTPLVLFPGQIGSAAVFSRSIVEINSQQIGQDVILQFEGGDPQLPIIMGVIRTPSAWPLQNKSEQVEVTADGANLTVSAKEEIVLRCGKASITLTKAGKVIIKGSYILNQSSGANRIKGGSVQIN